MRNDHTFSRRAVIAGFAAVPTFAATTAVADADMALIALGRKLTAAIQALDQAGSSKWPSAATSGVPAGMSLKTVNGNFTPSSAGQVIEGLNVTGEINITRSGVTVRNCRATAININAPNVTVEYCDAIGGTANNSAMSVVGGDGSTIRYCDISGTENGIWFESNNCLIEENYIHDLGYPSPDPHIDGIQLDGASRDNIIRHNNIDLNITTTTSCIIMPSTTTNLTIDSNRFNGGAYTVYVSGTGIHVTKNVFGAHTFGYVADRSANSASYSGNVDANGHPLRLP